MATIDSNIALGARPVQIEYPRQESPMNQMAAIMQLQNAQQTNQLNRQKMEEYARAREMEGVRRNALAGIDLNSPDSFNKVAQRLYDVGDLEGAQKMLGARAELEYKQAQTGKEKALSSKADVESKIEKTKLFTTQLPIIAQNPTDQAIEGWAKTLVQNGIMSMEQATAGMNQMLALPPEQRSQKLMQSALSAEKALEQHYVQQDLGGKKTIVAMPKYGEGKATVIKEDQVTLTPYEKGKLDIDRYKASKGEGGGVSEAPKLNKGERWNAELGRVEAVPGSDIYVKQSDKHGKDFQALQGVDTKVDSAVNKIDYILSPENKSGFEANFGGYNAYVAGRIPGKATDIRKNIDSLKSDLKAAGLELMRSGGSIGQITEREWPIIEGMIGALSPEMSEAEARLQFGKIKTYMDRIRTNAREAYDTEWGGSQYHKGDKKSPSPPAASESKNLPMKNSKNWTLHTDAKGNQAYVSPDGKSFEEVKK
jgi:hypothetical protein